MTPRVIGIRQALNLNIAISTFANGDASRALAREGEVSTSTIRIIGQGRVDVKKLLIQQFEIMEFK